MVASIRNGRCDRLVPSARQTDTTVCSGKLQSLLLLLVLAASKVLVDEYCDGYAGLFERLMYKRVVT